jgi:DNA-binding MarR family transcriptional regulator
MTTGPSPCVCTSLRKAARAVTRVYDDRLAATGLTTTQFAVLRNLARHGTLPLSRLADLLVMDRTSLYRTLAPIERQGWIAITARSARIKQADLTPAGHAKVESAAAIWEECQADIVGAVGADQWQALETQLRALVDVSRARTN